MIRSFSEKPRQVEEPTRLEPSCLSFFDSFVPIDGIPAFLLDSNGDASKPKVSVRGDWERSHTLVSTEANIDDPRHICCCAFSDDGSRLVSGRNSGTVDVWDVHRGVLHSTKQLHSSPICSITFRGNSNNVVLTADRLGAVLEWFIDGPSDIKRMDCSSHWEGEPHTNKLVQKPRFFRGGNKVVFSIKETPNDDSYGRQTIMKFAVIGSQTMDPDYDADVLETSVRRTDVVSRLEMSPDGKGLLVGFTDANVEQGYVMLWPDIQLYPQKSVLLSKGTLGNWSPDSQKVVTWTVPEDPFPQENDACCAFLWDIKQLRHEMQLSEDTLHLPFVELRNPSGKNVLWCHFVPDVDGRERLVMCVLSRKLKLIFWDTQLKHLTHIIDTSYQSV